MSRADQLIEVAKRHLVESWGITSFSLHHMVGNPVTAQIELVQKSSTSSMLRLSDWEYLFNCSAGIMELAKERAKLQEEVLQLMDEINTLKEGGI